MIFRKFSKTLNVFILYSAGHPGMIRSHLLKCNFPIILSEGIQTEKDKYHNVSYMGSNKNYTNELNIKKKQTYRSQIYGYQGENMVGRAE